MPIVGCGCGLNGHDLGVGGSEFDVVPAEGIVSAMIGADVGRVDTVGLGVADNIEMGAGEGCSVSSIIEVGVMVGMLESALA